MLPELTNPQSNRPQSDYIAEFQISTQGNPLTTTLSLALYYLSVLPPPPPPPPPEPTPEVSKDNYFITSLCNDLFRLKKSTHTLADSGVNLPAVRGIQRSLENLDSLFTTHHIEYRDLAGQEYHPGRNDFDPVAEAEESPDIEKAKILQCQQPTVSLNGRLIQKAKGIVVRPAKKQ
ncbi:MAG: hypothetical protein ABH878_09340 [bacterium]